jgi:hypothetical protein
MPTSAGRINSLLTVDAANRTRHQRHSSAFAPQLRKTMKNGLLIQWNCH